MLVPKTERHGPVEIDLTGPDGNAYVLMAYAQRFAEQLALDGSTILADMKSGDYEHLVDVFEQYFGEYVILYR